MATFREVTKAEYGWEEEDFTEELFLECLDPLPRMIARVLWSRREKYFDKDLKAIASLAELTNYNDVFLVAQGFSDSEHGNRLLRGILGVRPRGRRLLAIARELLPGRKQEEPKVQTAYHPGATWRNAPREPVAKPWVAGKPVATKPPPSATEGGTPAA